MVNFKSKYGVVFFFSVILISSCSKNPKIDLLELPLFPKPVSVISQGNSFNLNNKTKILVLEDSKELLKSANYLATITDCKTIVKGVQIAREIAQHEPLKGHVTEEYAPGSEVPLDDEEGTLDWVRKTAVTIYHPTGTCKMGTDEMSVVSPTLKVRGVEGLRVADASIMPKITSGNTNAPAIMIGEKASDLILKEA